MSTPSSPPRQAPPPPPPPPQSEAVKSVGEVSFSYNLVQQPPPPSIPPTNETPEMNTIKWSSGLCEWYSDFPNCVMTFFCPCVTFGQISEIVDKGTTTCAINGAIYALFLAVVGFACIYSPFYRRRMRFQYNLEGTNCGDFLIHTFCECCALCQEYRELKSRGFDLGLGWHANVERQQHQEATMKPPPHLSMRR